MGCEYCNICGELTFSWEKHSCDPLFFCWTIYKEEDKEDPGKRFSRKVYAIDHERAAEKYGEQDCDNDPEYYSTYLEKGVLVGVKDAEGGSIKVFKVSGESDVIFSAQESG